MTPPTQAVPTAATAAQEEASKNTYAVLAENRFPGQHHTKILRKSPIIIQTFAEAL